MIYDIKEYPAAIASKEKYCLFCGSHTTGRADKKFCDDTCRGAYNNQLKSSVNNYVRNVNNALGKNRRILESLLPGTENSIKVRMDKLIEQGFNFKYHTHTHKSGTGKEYRYCYEYGYLELDDEWYLIVFKN